MLCIFRPSLVRKELKLTKLFQINQNCHALTIPLGGGFWPHRELYGDIKPLKTFYILLQWGELFQGFYTLEIERWYGFYVADQDKARYSLCSAGEKCVSFAAPYATNRLFSTRLFLFN